MSTKRKDFNVAIIGSSGGGGATLGHTDPRELIRTVQGELEKVEGDSSRAQATWALFVALDGGKGFDNVVDEGVDRATLYYNIQDKDVNDDYLSLSTKSGSLQEINVSCNKESQKLAAAILDGKIHGLICISCSVNVFSETLRAAATANIPVTGTGGTSLSLASTQFHVRLVGNAGGSVATTSVTRAVSYTHALASDWKGVSYRPWRRRKSFAAFSTQIDDNRPSWKSVLNACLPAFWGVCLCKRLLQTLLHLSTKFAILNDVDLSSLSFLISVLENHALPIACAVVMATSVSNSKSSSAQDTSSLVMASVIASMVAWRSIICGLLAGYLVSIWQPNVLFWCIIHNIPATMTNLVASGGVGVVVALLVWPLSPLLRYGTELFRYTVLVLFSSSSASETFPAARAVLPFWLGCLSCYGSKVGWYHAIHLPLILVEMECGEASFLGAIDELTLVVVCAGVCSGNLAADYYFRKRKKEEDGVLSAADISLCQRAVRINLLYGDFVEACYPFMERHPWINAGCYLGSGLSTVVLVQGAKELPLSLAYLPLPVSIWLAGHNMFVASAVAFLIPFVSTVLNHIFLKPKQAQVK